MKILEDLAQAYADLKSLTLDGLARLTHEDLDALKTDFQDATDAVFGFLKQIGVMHAAGASPGAVAAVPAVAGFHPFRKLFVRHAKRLAETKALADGKTQEEFDAAWAAANADGKLTSDHIYTHAIGMGAIGDGTILNWLWSHKDEIVAFILSVLKLFGL